MSNYSNFNKSCIGIFYIDREHRERELASARTEQPSQEESSRPPPVYCDDPCLNVFSRCLMGLVSKFAGLYQSSQEWIHLEIAFFEPHLEASGECIAFSVENKGLLKKQRSFSKEYYNWIILNLRNEQLVNRVRTFCENAYRLGMAFDLKGTWRIPLWPRRPLPLHYWCIAFVVDALHEAGILKGYRSETLDVDDVVELLLVHPCHMRFALTPHRLKAVKERTTPLSLQQLLS